MSSKIASERALARLQRLCSRAEKCVADIRKKLSDWEISADEANTIVERLQASGFVNELRYAKAFVHDKSDLSRWGLVKIRSALRNKKISDEIIKEALREIDNLTQEKNLACLLSIKNKSLNTISAADRKVKLFRFALGRGYDYEMAAGVIGKLLK